MIEMFIIIIGPDGAGKSMLAKRIAKQTGFEIIAMDKPKSQEEKDNMFNNYCQMLLHKNNVIFDRFAYCEQIYGPIFRGCSALSDIDIYHIETILAEKGAIIIHCTANTNILWKRCQERGENFVKDRTTLKHIRHKYIKLCDESHLIPVVTYVFS